MKGKIGVQSFEKKNEEENRSKEDWAVIFFRQTLFTRGRFTRRYFRT